MFNINSYLQYQNTPKPKVLVEGVDYDCKTLHYLRKGGGWDYLDIANLSDCRGLATYNGIRDLSVISIKRFEGDPHEFINLLYFNGVSWIKYGTINGRDEFNVNNLENINKQALEPFESNPAKYSQLLWNCTQEEGWDKVYKLLGINKSL